MKWNHKDIYPAPLLGLQLVVRFLLILPHSEPLKNIILTERSVDDHNFNKPNTYMMVK